MQNSHFRSLLPTLSSHSTTNPPAQNTTPTPKPSVFGARARGGASSSLTPRNLKPGLKHGQARYDGHGAEGPPLKKFKSCAAPKGSKLASGYVDRARQREEKTGGEEVGGEGEATRTETGRLKGLDFDALERARRGGGDGGGDASEEVEVEVEGGEQDVEGELEEVLNKDVVVQGRSKTDDQRTIPDQQQQQQPQILSRNEILARLKQNRTRYMGSTLINPPASTPAPALDQSRFKKLASTPQPGKHKYTETINGRRREVLVITNKDGTTKKKTRWLDAAVVADDETGVSGREVRETVLGGDLPEQVLARQRAQVAALEQKREEEEGDDDIFGGVGEYDPLADMDDDEAENEKDEVTESKVDSEVVAKIPSDSNADKPSNSRRNYFTDDSSTVEINHKPSPSKDPHILAALHRASQLRRAEQQADATPSNSSSNDATNHEDRNKLLLAKLQKQSGIDDDAVDIDVDFGGSRYDDADDGDDGESDKRVKLSQWRGLSNHADEHESEDGDGDKKGSKSKANANANKKKPRSKGKKADKDSFRDIMGVLERRKERAH